MFVSNTCTLIGQINVSFVKWRCLGVCRQIVGFCWVVSNSGPELNWHWQWSGDQFNSMVNEIFSRDCYQQVPDFVWWSRKIHVCCCRAVKKGLTAQSLCHQGSIAINCPEPELSQVSKPYHIWIHIGLNLYNDIHQLCLILRDLPEVSLETLIIW